MCISTRMCCKVYTLLSTLGKLLTHIISNRLDNWAEHYFVYIEGRL